MNLGDVDPAYRTFIEDLLRRRGFDPARFSLDLSLKDEMFYRAILPGYPKRPGAAFYRYFESALRTHHVYRQLAEFLGGFEGLKRVLDFGSGYGRLTRTLLPRMRSSRIWAADIYPDAVAWQAETFGVVGLVSTPSPEKFGLRTNFDIVFAGSVFSHLPDGLFGRWLKRLYGLVDPRGLLAFSVHGEAYIAKGHPVDENGICFETWSESETLDPGLYGMSYVTRDYVSRVIAESCGAPASHVRAFPHAMYEGQDLWVVGGRDRDLSALQLTAAPLGGFQKVHHRGQLWNGWAVDFNPGARIVRADLYMDEELIDSMTPRSHPQETPRYFPTSPGEPVEWSFQRPARIDGKLVRVELMSSAGATSFSYASAPTEAVPAPERV